MDLNVVKKLIEKYKAGHAEFIGRADRAKAYYCNRNDILQAEQKKDKDEQPMRNADNRIPMNFHGLLVNQKVAYLFTYPPAFDVGKKQANKTIQKALGDEYQSRCMDLCVDASNAGVGWIHYWKDEEGAFRYAVCDSREVIPVYSTDMERRLLAVLRAYMQIDEETGESYDIYEYWTDAECAAYRCPHKSNFRDTLTPYEMFFPTAEEPASELQHGFGEVPFIPFRNNNLDTGDLWPIKRLIDVYDKVYSGFINDLEDVQELIFVLSGYGGESLNGFLQDLKKHKVIKLDPDPDGGADVRTLSIEIPTEARLAVLEATRKAIFDMGFGLDMQPEDFGNQSGVALQFMYSRLDMKAGLMKVQFNKGFKQLVRAICQHENISCDNILVTWYDNRIRNDVEQAQICQSSVGIISKKTILQNHPLVEDVEAELKQLDKEKEEAQQDFGFGDNFPHRHEEDEEQKDEPDEDEA